MIYLLSFKQHTQTKVVTVSIIRVFESLSLSVQCLRTKYQVSRRYFRNGTSQVDKRLHPQSSFSNFINSLLSQPKVRFLIGQSSFFVNHPNSLWWHPKFVFTSEEFAFKNYRIMR
ncbi:uncharacterized protein EV154DRAFT_485283 [Mucor mucedo]|uniref:uncharacterized protein n=1 Tax=Mucor mucedo TaxID=29922 RepID=UPI00221F3180|nr:uncharacterized protein EV154DRAFT_485283 [Mucor mucedo]KAI7885469.1 hypothetical protein EV154DRAFT_485283 [Mucor mucedo]